MCPGLMNRRNRRTNRRTNAERQSTQRNITLSSRKYGWANSTGNNLTSRCIWPTMTTCGITQQTMLQYMAVRRRLDGQSPRIIPSEWMIGGGISQESVYIQYYRHSGGAWSHWASGYYMYVYYTLHAVYARQMWHGRGGGELVDSWAKANVSPQYTFRRFWKSKQYERWLLFHNGTVTRN